MIDNIITIIIIIIIIVVLIISSSATQQVHALPAHLAALPELVPPPPTHRLL